jgi:hypothetical protein
MRPVVLLLLVAIVVALVASRSSRALGAAAPAAAAAAAAAGAPLAAAAPLSALHAAVAAEMPRADEQTDDEVVARLADPELLQNAEHVAIVTSTVGFWQGVFFYGGDEDGAGTTVLNGIVHGFMLGGGLESKWLAPLTMVEMMYQCTSSADACAESSKSLAIMLGMQLASAETADALRSMARWARERLPADLLDATKHADLRAGVLAQRKVRELAARLRRPLLAAEAKLAPRLAQGARALARASHGAVAKAAVARAPQIAARVAAAAPQKAAARAASAMAAKAAQGAGAKLAARLATRLATGVAGKAMGRLLLMAGGPAGVAAFLLQTAFDVATGVLDALCVGDFADQCHLSRAELQSIADAYGPVFDGAAAGPLLELRYQRRQSAAARAAAVQLARQRALARLVGDGNAMYRMTGVASLGAWLARVAALGPNRQLAEFARLKTLLELTSDAAAGYAAEREMCLATEGAAWSAAHGVCAVTGATCCARTEAVKRFFAFADANAEAGAGAARLVLYAMSDDPRVLVDAFEEHAADRSAWLRREAALDDDEEQLGLAHAVRVATLAVLSGERAVASAADARALLTRTHAQLPGSSAALTAALLDASLWESLTWPEVDDPAQKSARYFLHSYPALLALSYRWVPDGPRVSHKAACAGGAAEGLCLPDKAQMLDMHVCPFLRAQKPDAARRDKRMFEGDGPGLRVNWERGVCVPTTRYCEAYARYPALHGERENDRCAQGLGSEMQAKVGKEAAAFLCVGQTLGPMGWAQCAAGRAAAGGPPGACADVRRLCADGEGDCECAWPAFLEPFRFVGGDTVTGFLHKYAQQ